MIANVSPNLSSPPAAEQPQAGPRAAPTREQRQALIRAYQSQALAQPDALMANLAMLNGDLMAMACQSQEMVEALLAEGLTPSECQRRVTSPIEMHLKIVRQIDRMVQIEQRHTKAPPVDARPK